jgi:hypothetical protein
MIRIKVKIKGVCPILQCRHLTPEEEIKITGIDPTNPGKHKRPTDEMQFKMHVYKERGKFYQPSSQLEACMVSAANEYKVKGNQGYSEYFKAGVIIEEEKIFHKNHQFVMSATPPKNPKVWYMFACYVTNTMGKKKIQIWTIRPRVDEWELEFTINVLLDEKISVDIVRKVLEFAGGFKAIGAWRPKFGRFKVVSFKVIK